MGLLIAKKRPTRRRWIFSSRRPDTPHQINPQMADQFSDGMLRVPRLAGSQIVIQMAGAVALRVHEHCGCGDISIAIPAVEDENRQSLSFDFLLLDRSDLSTNKFGVVLALNACRRAHDSECKPTALSSSPWSACVRLGSSARLPSFRTSVNALNSDQMLRSSNARCLGLLHSLSTSGM